MSLADVIRKGVAVIDAVTTPLQLTVAHRVRTGDGSQGPSYSTAVNRKAIVDYAPKLVRMKDGQEIAPKASVIFPRSVVIAPGDEITLPNGTIGEVLDVPGVADPATTRPYASEVFVG